MTPEQIPGAKVTGVNFEAFTAIGAEISPPKRSKYGNSPTVYNGVKYASKAEADYARLLDATPDLWWIGQPKFRLGVPENVYVADFLVFEEGRDIVHVVDVKGHRTPKFKRDVKLWKAYGPCPLLIVSGKKSEWIRPKPQRTNP